MTACIKIIGFLAASVLIGCAICANTQPISDDPCNYEECTYCPFPCERNRK